MPFDSEGNVLILKRRATQHCGDLWSFPGGKIESGESPEVAAKRELEEETGLDGSNWESFGDYSFEYSDRLLHFLLFRCLCEREMTIHSESPYTWVPVEQLDSYPMPEANIGILELIR